MIKFKAETATGPLYGFGLTAENIALMLENQPLFIDLADMGPYGAGSPTGNIVIFYGQDEEAVLSAFRSAGLVTEETAILRPRTQGDA
ncbi:MAG TPA: hypothetical protein VKP65_26095 [Rhodothermales bacterium]|nr:hypothetical protein [Rhodothermales bacterium]